MSGLVKTQLLEKEPLFMQLWKVLHLLNDDFNSCHELAQTQEENTYLNHLHSIIHRREPDYWVYLRYPITSDQHYARYWIAQVSHEHLAKLYSPGGTIPQAKEGMGKFVDEVTGNGVADQGKKQWEKMTTLAIILIDSEGEL